MAPLRIRRINCADAGAARELSALRERLASHGELVSPRARALTVEVFGEPLPPARAVERICDDVRARGLDAVLHYTERFDRVRLDATTLRVSADELDAAHRGADPAFLAAVRRVRQNVMAFQLGLLHTDAVLSVPGSHDLRLRYRPVRRAGLCIPGGAAAYPSTLLMTVCPAQAAGVKEIAVVVPPGRNGADNPDVLAVCRELGVSEVYRVGGAQGVAALAYGVEGLPAVDVIAGPGNTFVALAKRYVFGRVGIDMMAGPTEVVVVADDTVEPRIVAADLIAQAEHGPGASILVTWHPPLADAVAHALDSQLAGLARAEQARDSLESFGALVTAAGPEEALACANDLAPEHLHLATADPEAHARAIDNAGAIFLGHEAAVALGDYAAGPSHVLPTGGTARFAGGLTANHFLRGTSMISVTRAGLEHFADDVRMLALREGLTGHAASVDVRLGRAGQSAKG